MACANMSKQTGIGSRTSQVGCNGHICFSGPCEVLMSGTASGLKKLKRVLLRSQCQHARELLLKLSWQWTRAEPLNSIHIYIYVEIYIYMYVYIYIYIHSDSSMYVCSLIPQIPSQNCLALGCVGVEF